jgi:hypothetical protein
MCKAVAMATLFTGFGSLPAFAADSEPPVAAVASPTTQPTTRPEPKPLSEQVNKGLAYLVKIQLPSGAWPQGDESAAMGNTLGQIKDSPNVADTCMAALALLHSGSAPTGGPYQNQLLKAIAFVCDQCERSSENDLAVTDLRGTRTQMKLGTFIDTFMAVQLLGEVKNIMPDAVGTKRVNDVLAKVLKKIEANQQKDGRWANAGWAPVLAQGQAAKSINVAAQNGGVVDEKTRAGAEHVAREEFAQLDKHAAPGDATAVATAGGPTGAPTATGAGTLDLGGRSTFTGGAASRAGSGAGSGDAGVELYSRASQVAALQASANSNAMLRPQFQSIAAQPTTSPAARAEATAMLQRFADNDRDLFNCQNAIIERLKDKQFVAGFGSNGGEEFLSYLNIGESLVLKGGDAWKTWDQRITENLNRIQNDEGSWSGQHCITGRTFCTAAALMVLTVDRAPDPVAAALTRARGR